MSSTDTDLVGQELAPAEAELLVLYQRTKALLQRDDLPPCAQRNLVQSAAALNQAVNDLGITWEMLYDIGA